MALEAPLSSSAESLNFTLDSPGNRAAARSDTEEIMPSYRIMSASPPAAGSGLLRPDYAIRPSSHSPRSPGDFGRSPVTSNGTEGTEIDDDVADDVEQEQVADFDTHGSKLHVRVANYAQSAHQLRPDVAISAVHAAESFASWTSIEPAANSSLLNGTSSPQDINQKSGGSHHGSPPQPHRPLLSTNVKPVRYSVDSATPRAQDLQDILSEDSRLRSNSNSSLDKIDEQTEAEGDDDEDNHDDEDDEDIFNAIRQSDEVVALQTALRECWVLCNTMATLSSSQRAKLFKGSGTPDPRERAWGACWKLCQHLYESQGRRPRPASLAQNLELCRDFCQALFEVREKQDEMGDSILRVSFELNNHLYTAQGLHLPDQFQKRTLDFYITLCHRLMKQKGELQGEADQLLRACWDLTETLFSLWQSGLEDRPLEEASLGTAVQACWDLCDLFKRSCKQIRPERSATRSSQTSFFSLAGESNGRESRQSNLSRHSKRESVKSLRQEERPRLPACVPETPVTEFEDTPLSPDRSPTAPNLMVLGSTGDHGRGGRWSSSASNLSSYSHNSARTSSTATTTAGTEDRNVTRAKMLVIRAAMDLGFVRDDLDDAKTAATKLKSFIKELPAGSFGPLAAQATLLQQYKMSVLSDASFLPHSFHTMPARGKRVSAVDMAKSVKRLSSSSPRYSFLRNLYNLVFQFAPEDADVRRNPVISV